MVDSLFFWAKSGDNHSMNVKTILYRLLILLVLGVGGLLMIGIVYNLLIMAGAVPDGMNLRGSIQNTAFVFMGSIVASLLSLAIKDKILAKVLLFAPLYAPGLFAVVNVLIH
jgi:hypothetical protein